MSAAISMHKSALRRYGRFLSDAFGVSDIIFSPFEFVVSIRIYIIQQMTEKVNSKKLNYDIR